MKDVAKEAGVSIATVSHVLNGTRYVDPSTKNKVEQAINRLNYTRNKVAASLKTEKTHTIGLIVSDISNPFFSNLVRSVEDVSIDNNYSLMVCNTDENVEKEALYTNVLIEKKIDGIIIAPAGTESDNIQQIKSKNIPLIFIDRKIDNVKASAVLSNDIKASYEATKMLLELDHKRIGLILGLEGVTTTEERLIGYKKALSESEVSFNQEFVEYADSRIEGGREAARKLLSLSKSISAIFSTNNLMTIGAMKAIKKNDLNCPLDISLVGFGDFSWASTFEPTLTVIKQNPYRIGSIASEMLLEKIKSENNDDIEKEVRVDTKLIERNSTSKYSE